MRTLTIGILGQKIRLTLPQLSRLKGAYARLLPALQMCAARSEMALTYRIDSTHVHITFDELDLKKLPVGTSLRAHKDQQEADGIRKRKGRKRSENYKAPTDPWAADPSAPAGTPMPQRPVHPEHRDPVAAHPYRSIGIDLNPGWIGITVVEVDPTQPDSCARTRVLDSRLIHLDLVSRKHIEIRDKFRQEQPQGAGATFAAQAARARQAGSKQITAQHIQETIPTGPASSRSWVTALNPTVHADSPELTRELLALAATQAVSLARKWHAGLMVLEEGVGKIAPTNRGDAGNAQVAQWNRRAFRDNVQRKTRLAGLTVLYANPAYSSFIGNLSFELPDACASAAEMARRGWVIRHAIQNGVPERKAQSFEQFAPHPDTSVFPDRWKDRVTGSPVAGTSSHSRQWKAWYGWAHPPKKTSEPVGEILTVLGYRRAHTTAYSRSCRGRATFTVDGFGKRSLGARKAAGWSAQMEWVDQISLDPLHNRP